LLHAEVVGRERLVALDREVRLEMRQAREFALASPEPNAELAAEYVLAPAR
jgi:TPP-dependent pyruvate/acetoin dehydrogenase alpha subunit